MPPPSHIPLNLPVTYPRPIKKLIIMNTADLYINPLYHLSEFTGNSLQAKLENADHTFPTTENDPDVKIENKK